MKKKLTSLFTALFCVFWLTGAGWLPLAKSSGGGCSQATTWLSGKTTAFSADYTTMICGLVSDGDFASFDRIYIHATDNTTNALTDIVTNALATITGAATFTANSGYVPTTGVLNTTLNFTTATNYSQNSALLMGWPTGTSVDNGCIVGEGTVTGDIYFQNANFGSVTGGAINGGAIPSVSPVGGFTGLFAADRSSSSTVTVYQNGSSIGSSGASTSAAPSNTTAQGWECAAGGVYSQNIALVAFGKSLGAAGQARVYARFHTFLHAVNATLYP